MRLILLIGLSVIVFACPRKQASLENQSVLTYRKDSVILIKTIYHDFSQISNPDKFLICIRGKSILEGQVVFTITDIEGVEIFCEVFPAAFLLDYGVDPKADSTTKENYIRNRYSEFFNETNFFVPAIKPEEIFDEDYSKINIWEDIKGDQTAIGFQYLIGEEDNRRIAFSKKIKKVVLYFNCC